MSAPPSSQREPLPTRMGRSLNRMPLRSQILLVILLGSLMPMMLAYGWLASHATKSFRQQALTNLENVAKTVEAQVQAWQEESDKGVELVSKEGAATDQGQNVLAMIVDANGKVLGGVTRARDLREFSNEIGAVAFGQTGFVCVLDAAGKIVAGPSSVLERTESFARLAGLSENGADLIRDREGRKWLTHLRTLSSGVRVVALEQEQDVLNQASKFLWAAILIAAGIFSLTTVVSTYFVGAILRPINELKLASEKLQGGQWDVRVRVQRRDELGQLVLAFNNMAQRLGNQYAMIEDEVSKRTEQLRRENQERQKAETSLRLKQNELEAMNEASPLGIFSTDAGGLYLYTNQVFREIFDALPVLGASWIEGLHPDDRAAVVAKWGLAIGGGTPFESIHRLLLSQDRIRWVSVKAASMADGQKITGYVGTVEDITELKLLEQRLVAQNQMTHALAQSRTVQEAAPEILRAFCAALGWDLCGLWLADRGSAQLSFVGAWHQPALQVDAFVAMSRSVSLARGAGLPGRVWEDGQPLWIPDVMADETFLRRTALNGQLHTAFALPIYLNKQVVGIVEVFSSHIQEHLPGLVDFMSGWCSEISQFIARARAEEERNAMEIQMRHSQKMESIGQLAAGIAHEINTPTQFISDNTRFLKDAFDDVNGLLARYGRLLKGVKAQEPSAALVAEVEAAAADADIDYVIAEVPKAIQQSLDGLERVSRIVRAMKEFSHPGSELKSEINLNRTIESTIIVASNEWKYIADMKTDFDPALPTVPCLVGELNQVVLNLIVNASHAIADVVGDNSGKKGIITVSTRADGGFAEIRIGDTGTGIPEQHRARIFDPFFTTKQVGKGTGQGLAIAHAVIVEKHGGTLSFETEMGKGTTFLIRLPLTATAEHLPDLI